MRVLIESIGSILPPTHTRLYPQSCVSHSSLG